MLPPSSPSLMPINGSVAEVTNSMSKFFPPQVGQVRFFPENSISLRCFPAGSKITDVNVSSESIERSRQYQTHDVGKLTNSVGSVYAHPDIAIDTCSYQYIS
jgi:hypothetical protein